MRLNKFLNFILIFSFSVFISCERSNQNIISKEEIDSNIEFSNEIQYQKHNNSLSLLNKNKFTDEEIFLGIFFAHGAVAKKIKKYESAIIKIEKELNEDSKIKVQQELHKFYVHLKSKHKDQMEDFVNKIKSGDPYEIDLAIKESSIMLYKEMDYLIPGTTKTINQIEVLAKNGKIKTDSNGNLPDDQKLMLKKMYEDNVLKSGFRACSFALVCVAYFAVAVHNTAAITVAAVAVGVGGVYLAVVLWKANWVFNNLESDESSELQYEFLINDISSMYY